MSDRPLWRTSTRVLMHELLRREDREAWKKLLVEMPGDLLLDELRRRGWEVIEVSTDGPLIVAARRTAEAMLKDDDATALYDAQAQAWVGPLGKRWPPEGGDGD